jgi:hypothetical protein
MSFWNIIDRLRTILRCSPYSHRSLHTASGTMYCSYRIQSSSLSATRSCGVASRACMPGSSRRFLHEVERTLWFRESASHPTWGMPGVTDV